MDSHEVSHNSQIHTVSFILPKVLIPLNTMCFFSVYENEDVLVEILFRLPPKPLTSFKIVSKQWLALISNPLFVRQYLISNNFPSSLLLTPSPSFSHQHQPIPIFPLTLTTSPTLFNFRFLNLPNSSLIQLTQSCNGLLLVHTTQTENTSSRKRKSKSKSNNTHSSHNLFVCNPLTKRFLSFQGMKFCSFFLAYDPLKSSHFKVVSIGFVNRFYDPSKSLDTKTLPRYDHYTNIHEITIYSSETGCWSDHGVHFTAPSSMTMNLGVYCNGSVHWYVNDSESLYFDVENQCFKTYPMPPNIRNCDVRYFGESRGHLLHMILLSPVMFLFDIFELEEDYSGWSLKFHGLDLSPIQAAFAGLNLNFEDDMFPLFDVLRLVRQEKEQNIILVLHIPNKVLLSYNFMDATFREISGFRSIIRSHAPWVGGSTFSSFEFIENIYWVGGVTA